MEHDLNIDSVLAVHTLEGVFFFRGREIMICVPFTQPTTFGNFAVALKPSINSLHRRYYFLLQLETQWYRLFCTPKVRSHCGLFLIQLIFIVQTNLQWLGISKSFQNLQWHKIWEPLKSASSLVLWWYWYRYRLIPVCCGSKNLIDLLPHMSRHVVLVHCINVCCTNNEQWQIPWSADEGERCVDPFWKVSQLPVNLLYFRLPLLELTGC